MPKLKILSGKNIIEIFKIFGFSIVSQKGSHVKLGRHLSSARQTLTIPNHKELDKGTIRAIYTQALRYVSDAELRKYFYTK